MKTLSGGVDLIGQALMEGRRLTDVAQSERDIEGLSFWLRVPLSQSWDPAAALILRKKIDACRSDRCAMREDGLRKTGGYLEACYQEIALLKELQVLYQHRMKPEGEGDDHREKEDIS